MKVTRRNGKDERRILIAMISHHTTLGRISSVWKGNMFANDWANIVGQWCIDFYDTYGEAPRHEIEVIFSDWSQSGTVDEDTSDLVESFLTSLNNEYEALSEDINSDYVLDLCDAVFNRNKLSRLSDSIRGKLDVNKVKEAQVEVEKHSRVEVGLGSAVNVLEDEEAIKAAFAEALCPVFKFGGDLGKFFGNEFYRGAFLSILAPEKRGKTFWLVEIAVRALLSRCKVAFFSAGDMDQNQMIKRMMHRVVKHPKHKGIQEIPTEIEGSERSDREVVTKSVRYDSGLTWQKALKTIARIKKMKTRTNKPLLKLSSHPANTLTVKGIETQLDRWELEDWIPDVIILDYMDIMQPPHGSDAREKTNLLWMEARALPQKRHCCLVTASQADAGSYTAETMGMGNFSEDKRKLSHVTGMFGLNQTPVERDRGLYRLSWIVRREKDRPYPEVVHVAGNLGLASPAIISKF